MHLLTSIQLSPQLASSSSSGTCSTSPLTGFAHLTTTSSLPSLILTKTCGSPAKVTNFSGSSQLTHQASTSPVGERRVADTIVVVGNGTSIVTSSVVQFGLMMVLVGAVDRETGAISPEVILWAAKLSVPAVSVRREEQAQKTTLDLCFGYPRRMFKSSFAAIRSDDIETGTRARFIAKKTGFGWR